ncbi:hypothetical protein G4G28_18225 [Massilia sp. Dwa41.01b]|uniref:hypothetical protein n=1 Tax=unclassified Massilia TaxID=2609279 RepID=UPI001600961D|nr:MULTISPECIES: hypothetical protein [unclassified Massilia]QNA89949.1 hypothetical protein G4G28_18225 [Massilia sp. Dwa41.01b]QNB00831.1 hypothetical protein G4G31_21785 [Massilia sp. Se16.2.3]
MLNKHHLSGVLIALGCLPLAVLAGTGATPAPASQLAADVVAFVGEKISVEVFPDTPEEIAARKAEDERVMKERGMQRVSMRLNTRLKAKYRVLKVVAGQHTQDTIEFIAVDHYGRPRFAEQNPVLLYVKKDGAGAYVHVRYPYSFVYPTRDGNWASCSTGTELPERDSPELLQAVHRVDFAPAVEVPAAQLQARLAQAMAMERASHYDIAGERATCRQGLTVGELVALHANKVAAD